MAKLLKEDGNALLQENGFFILLDITYLLITQVGAFTLTGVSTGLNKGYNLVSTVGAFALTGIDTIFKRSYLFAVSTASFILTGISATLRSSGWNNQSKSATSTITTQSKNTASWTNQTKH